MNKQDVNKNKYSQEFKEQVLEVFENSPKSLPQIAQEFGLSYGTLYSWRANKQKFVKSNSKPNSNETKKLTQEIERLKKENEILKKATAFFAKQLD